MFNKLLKTYSNAARLATKGLIRNWVLVLASIAAFILYQSTAQLFGRFGFAGGMVVGLANLLLLTLYYSWLSEVSDGGRLEVKELIKLDYSLFSGTINAAFIIYLATLLASYVFHGSNSALILILNLLIVLVFNALPESLYIQRYDGMGALSFAANFTRENWIEWYLPFVLLLTPFLYQLGSMPALIALSGSTPFLPASIIVLGATEVLVMFGINQWLGLLLGVILSNWFMLFRAELFRSLERGVRF